MRFVLLVIFAVTLLFQCACSGVPAPPVEPAGPRTLIDQADRTIEINDPVEKIISGYYISSSVCIALGLVDKLVGIEARADTRPIYALAKPELLSLPSVGTAKDFNLETCLTLNPDLVILPYRQRDVADNISEMGISAILVNPESYSEIIEMIALIGNAANVQERAERLINWCNDARDTLQKQTASVSVKPGVYICGVSSWLTTVPKDMYQAVLIDLAGGYNVAGSVEGSGWFEISYEQFLVFAPDVIIIPSEASYDIEDILSDPLLINIPAVRDEKVYKMPSAFEAWDSPVPSSMLGAKWLMSVLHENIYTIETLRREAADFYKEFYKIEIDASLI